MRNSNQPIAGGSRAGRRRLRRFLTSQLPHYGAEWSGSPEDALLTMVALNNKYALDGRDPNSVSGIFWVLGRYDRPWAPEREILGRIRYMSSQNTARKMAVKRYVDRYGPALAEGKA